MTDLLTFLRRVPAIDPRIGHGESGGLWRVKLVIDIRHPLVFKPVSPPPYLNGGPEEFLSWVIEAQAADFMPATCAKWLEGGCRIPWTIPQPGSSRADCARRARTDPECFAVHPHVRYPVTVRGDFIP
jgi:hypothetical protein